MRAATAAAAADLGGEGRLPTRAARRWAAAAAWFVATRREVEALLARRVALPPRRARTAAKCAFSIFANMLPHALMRLYTDSTRSHAAACSPEQSLSLEPQRLVVSSLGSGECKSRASSSLQRSRLKASSPRAAPRREESAKEILRPRVRGGVFFSADACRPRRAARRHDALRHRLVGRAAAAHLVHARALLLRALSRRFVLCRPGRSTTAPVDCAVSAASMRAATSSPSAAVARGLRATPAARAAAEAR